MKLQRMKHSEMLDRLDLMKGDVWYHRGKVEDILYNRAGCLSDEERSLLESLADHLAEADKHLDALLDMEAK